MSLLHPAVCSWSLQPKSPADLLENLRHTGLSRVQLALSPIADEPQLWGTSIPTLRGGEIEIVSGMMAMAGEDYSTLDSIARTGGIRLDDRWEENRRHAGIIAALASDSGLSLVTFHAGFIPEAPGDPERDKLLGRLRDIADIFADHSVRLGLETGQESAPTLLEALAEVDHPHVGVNFDPANMILYAKGDPVDALRMLKDHVVQIHIKDATPTATPGTWGAEVPAGTGAVDWPEFFTVVKTIEPAVNLVIEREAGDDRISDIITARKLVEGMIEG